MYLIIPRKVYIIICLHNAYYLKGLLPNFLAMVFEQVFFYDNYDTPTQLQRRFSMPGHICVNIKKSSSTTNTAGDAGEAAGR